MFFSCRMTACRSLAMRSGYFSASLLFGKRRRRTVAVGCARLGEQFLFGGSSSARTLRRMSSRPSGSPNRPWESRPARARRLAPHRAGAAPPVAATHKEPETSSPTGRVVYLHVAFDDRRTCTIPSARGGRRVPRNRRRAGKRDQAAAARGPRAIEPERSEWTRATVIGSIRRKCIAERPPYDPNGAGPRPAL